MSRSRFPWLFAAALSGMLALTGTASAQDLQRQGGSQRLYHGQSARQVDVCSRAGATGDSSDVSLRACDEALPQVAGADRVAILTNRGLIHLRRNELDLALSDIDAALTTEPNNPDIMLNRGVILVRQHDYAPAVPLMTQALSLGVHQAYKAYYTRGLAREGLGDQRGALEDYNTSLQIQPDWGPAEAEVARFIRGRQQRLAGMLSDTGAPVQPPRN